MACKKKIESNRKNALKSTGPKSERGLQVSSKNALRHGILSKGIVIQGGEGKESMEEYQRHQESIAAYYQPVGPVEEMLVERISSGFWRLRRVLAYETGSIRSNLDSITEKRKFGREDAFHIANQIIRNTGRDNVYRTLMNSTSKGVNKIIEQMQQAKQQLKRKGFVDPDFAMDIMNTVGDYHKGGLSAGATLGADIKTWNRKEMKDFVDPLIPGLIAKGEIDPKEKDPKKILKILSLKVLDLTIKELKKEEKRLKKQEKLSDEAARLAAHLPTQADIEKICRYESHLSRQISKSIEQLEKLQRMRLGIRDSQPIRFDLNVDNVTISKRDNLPNEAK